MGLKAFRACELPWSVWPLPAPNSWGVSQGREGPNTFPWDCLKPDVQRSLSGVKHLVPMPSFVHLLTRFPWLSTLLCSVPLSSTSRELSQTLGQC